MKILQITKTGSSTRKVLTRFPVFVVTFTPGTDVRKVLQTTKLCHCIIRWEKYKNSRPVRQCYNCQAFGHSSNFCGKISRCVKCDQQHATKDCKKKNPQDPHQNAQTAKAPTRQTSRAAHSTSNRFNSSNKITNVHNDQRRERTRLQRHSTTNESNSLISSSLRRRTHNSLPHDSIPGHR